MENIIEEIRQKELNLFSPNDKTTIYNSYSNKSNINNINSNNSQNFNSFTNYTIKHKPIFNQKQKEIKQKIQKPKKNYETFIINNNYNINSPNLFDEIKKNHKKRDKDRQNLEYILYKRNKDLFYNDLLRTYESFDKIKENQKKEEENKNNNNKLKKENENDIFIRIKKMHESIIKKRKNNEMKFKNGNMYENIIDNILSEIDIVRKQRQIENKIVKEKIKLLKNDIFEDKLYKYQTPNRNKDKTKNIYLNNYNKKKFITEPQIKRKKGKYLSFDGKNKKYFNNKSFRILQEIDYKMYKYNNIKKYNKLPKYIRKKLNEKNYKDIQYYENPMIKFYEKTINQIKKLDKENQLIEKKYKNIPISNNELNEIIIKKINYNDGFNKKINFKKNKTLIQRNINHISGKIIDELLYEIIIDLMNIESKKSNEYYIFKLKQGFNNICINLNLLNEEEYKILSKYNDIEYMGSKSYKFNYDFTQLKSKKNFLKIDADLIKRIENNKLIILENKILNGSFFSDFNIFDIYDEFVDEQVKIILEDEINYFINKNDLLVEKICHEEIKQVENDINSQ